MAFLVEDKAIKHRRLQCKKIGHPRKNFLAEAKNMTPSAFLPTWVRGVVACLEPYYSISLQTGDQPTARVFATFSANFR